MSKDHIYFFLAISLVGLCCNSSDLNDKEKRNNHWVWWVDASSNKGKWIPYGDKRTVQNGIYTQFFYDGKIAEKGTIRKGKNVDTSFWFDRVGDIYGYKIYTLDSAIDYYVNDGPIKVYDYEGKLRMEGIIKNHKPSTKWAEYYKSGFLKKEISFVNDTGWLVRYYENQQIDDSEFVMGKVYVIIKHWYENGQLAHSVGWKNYLYNGEVIDYFENGQLKQRGRCANGKIEGEGRYWYPSGQLNGITNWVDGVQIGKQIIYYENGQIQMETNVKDGRLDGEQKRYDQTGKLIDSQFYDNGMRLK